MTKHDFYHTVNFVFCERNTAFLCSASSIFSTAWTHSAATIIADAQQFLRQARYKTQWKCCPAMLFYSSDVGVTFYQHRWVRKAFLRWAIQRYANQPDKIEETT